ncbi:hypothetical protein [Streptomyces sp. NPDC088794]|uniref:hypothetical protein n=1 Tax=Streptomyces sp. NPDC088794 TaxID=3365902 RepID=UPI003815F9E9
MTGALGSSPVSVALDGRGSAYVTVMSGELRRVDLAGGSTSTVAAGLGNLRGLDLDGQGSAYVGSFEGVLQKADLLTGAREEIARGLGPVHGVSVAGGRVYVASGDGSIYKAEKGQQTERVVTGLGLPLDLVADGDSAYVADVIRGTVGKVDLADGSVTTLDSGAYEPQSLSRGADGAVYFLAGGEFHRVDPVTGRKTTAARLTSLSAYDFTLAANGDAYVTSSDGSLWRLNGLAR